MQSTTTTDEASEFRPPPSCPACEDKMISKTPEGKRVCTSCGYVSNELVLHHPDERSREAFANWDGRKTAEKGLFAGRSDRKGLAGIGVFSRDERIGQRREQARAKLSQHMSTACRTLHAQAHERSAQGFYSRLHGDNDGASHGEYALYVSTACVIVAMKKARVPVSLPKVANLTPTNDVAKLTRVYKEVIKKLKKVVKEPLNLDCDPITFIEPLAEFIQALADSPTTASKRPSGKPLPAKSIAFLQELRPKIRDVRELALKIIGFAQSLDLTEGRKPASAAVAVIYMSMEVVTGRSMNRSKDLWEELTASAAGSVYTARERYREIECAIEDWADWLPMNEKLKKLRITGGWRGRKADPMPKKEFFIRVLPEVLNKREEIKQMRKAAGGIAGAVPTGSRCWANCLGSHLEYQRWKQRHDVELADNPRSSSPVPSSSARSESPQPQWPQSPRSSRNESPASSSGLVSDSIAGDDFSEDGFGFYKSGVTDDWKSEADSDFSDEEMQAEKEKRIMADPLASPPPAETRRSPITFVEPAMSYAQHAMRQQAPASPAATVSRSPSVEVEYSIGGVTNQGQIPAPFTSGWAMVPPPTWPNAFSTPPINLTRGRSQWVSTTSWEDPRFQPYNNTRGQHQIPTTFSGRRVREARIRGLELQRSGDVKNKRWIYARFRPSDKSKKDVDPRVRSDQVLGLMEFWLTELQEFERDNGALPDEKVPPKRSDWAWESYALRHLLRNGADPAGIPLYLFPQSIAAARSMLFDIQIDDLAEDVLFEPGEMEGYLADEGHTAAARLVWEQEGYDEHLKNMADLWEAKWAKNRAAGAGQDEEGQEKETGGDEKGKGKEKPKKSRIDADRFAQLMGMVDDDSEGALTSLDQEMMDPDEPEEGICNHINLDAIRLAGGVPGHAKPKESSESRERQTRAGSQETTASGGGSEHSSVDENLSEGSDASEREEDYEMEVVEEDGPAGELEAGIEYTHWEDDYEDDE